MGCSEKIFMTLVSKLYLQNLTTISTHYKSLSSSQQTYSKFVMVPTMCWYNDWAMCWMVGCFNPCRGKKFFSFAKCPHWLWVTQPPIQWVFGFYSLGTSSWDVKLATYLQLMQGWMSGALLICLNNTKRGNSTLCSICRDSQNFPTCF